LQEPYRDLDTARVETAPLQMIGRVGLTCEELERFFDDAIQAGKTTEHDSDDENVSFSTMPARQSHNPLSKSNQEQRAGTAQRPLSKNLSQAPGVSAQFPEDLSKPEKIEEGAIGGNDSDKKKTNREHDQSESGEWEIVDTTKEELYVEKAIDNYDSIDNERIDRIVSRKIFWNSVAIGSFVLGAGCLLFALHISRSDNTRYRGGSGIGVRRWSTAGR
jgi:hypothetical protein